jgi:chromosome segregation ATPase
MSLSKEDLADIRTLIVEGTMEALNAVVIPRLDEHDKRFEAIDKRFDQIEAHLAEHDRRFDALDRRLDNIEHRLTKLEGRVEALENDVKELYDLVPAWARDSDNANLSPEERLRQLYGSVQALAHELNIEL